MRVNRREFLESCGLASLDALVPSVSHLMACLIQAR